MNIITLKRLTILACCISYALLFFYAAASKTIEYSEFRLQIGQSPIISAYATLISYAIPIIEILIGCLLLIERFRLLALFAGYSLMSLFTAYIYLILNYSPYVPCSCGGILESMDWQQHLIFNIAFLLFAIVAILLSSDHQILATYENQH